MIGGIVLAAGEGRRFGGSKMTAELGGAPLLDYAIEAMWAVPAIERIVVVLGAHADEIASRVDLEGVEAVRCEAWREGISASLRSGVEALAEAQAVVVSLGDQPFITPQVIAAVLDGIDSRRPAARATYEGRPGHPVLIKRELFEDVRELRGDSGARDLLTIAGVREIECAHLCSETDIDTLEDLERVRRRTPVSAE